MNRVSVEDNVSKDLEQCEEAVFEVIALNPEEEASKIREKYDVAPGRVLECIDKLMEKGLVEQVESGEYGGLVWKVTELGRLKLLRFVDMMRFDIMEARLQGQSSQEIEMLERKKQGFKTAYKQSKALFEEEGGGLQ